MLSKLAALNRPPAPSPGCGACRDGDGQPFPFSMAFQPIVNASSQRVFAYEALVRGVNREPAYELLRQVTEENRYAFDQACRVEAISLAAKLELAKEGAKLSVNFMPGAVYSPTACIQRTLRAARETGFPLGSLIFEITENEKVRDTAHLNAIVTEYRKHGFALALDDFGAGYSGMNLLAELEVEFVKLDAKLVREIHLRPRAQDIVHAIVALAKRLGTTVIGECVEVREEYDVLRDAGVNLMQGYLFAKPEFKALPTVAWP